VKTVDELIAKARSKPGEIAYASSGIGRRRICRRNCSA